MATLQVPSVETQAEILDALPGRVSAPLAKLFSKWGERIEDGMTTEAARDHVKYIREDEGFLSDDGDEVLGSTADKLTRALDLLATQLYTQPTHFLLEFIQNADDNLYAENVLPTLSFCSRPGTLSINCNERGFRPKNVEAICDIGNSTKRDRSKGFIGEKGIGFKSVFKITDIIHIASNAYSFRFEREGKLGMIAPIWSEHPGAILDGFTQFYLTLSKQKTGDSEYNLRSQLRQLDSTLLLFLRNLREISVDIDNGTQTKQGKFTKYICRQDYQEYGGEMIRIRGDRNWLRRLPEDAEYLVVRHRATNMPDDAKRHGMSSSEVVLAFPFKSGKPTFARQKAYAFLPIRESGFRFLLQADFLLIANREDVEENEWNRALLDGIAAGFVSAVQRFNHPDAAALRYMWLGFLQNMPISSINSFAPLGDKIVTALASSAVFESDLGYFVAPADAIFVPSKFRDDNGTFLLQRDLQTDDEVVSALGSSSNGQRKHYISNRYEQEDPKLEMLQKLGVEIMSFPMFLGLLRKLIDDYFYDYKAKPDGWHSMLAEILLENASESQTMSLALIPLRDGRWVRRVDAQCYFETDDATVYNRLPEGIPELLIVHKAIADSPIRLELLRKLGVKELTRAEVCRLLIACHENSHARELETDALLSHARYLFEVIKPELHISKPKTFWVHDLDRAPRLAANTYLDTNNATIPRMSLLLPPEQCPDRLLHPSYSLEYNGRRQDAWYEWLEKFLGLRSTLRIADAGAQLTPELRFIADKQPSALMLAAFMATAAKEKSAFEHKVVRDMVGALKVTCLNGTQARLSQICLPTAVVRGLAIEGLLFVKVNNPDADEWPKLLEKFGVVVKADLAFYLRCLSLMLGKSTSVETATRLYRKIENHAIENFEKVQGYFQVNNAIYIPDGHVWLTRSACVWSGTPGLAGEQPLSDIYPSLYNFFWFTLNIRSATIESVIERLRNMSVPGQDNPELRRQLLFSLSRRVTETESDIPKLRGLENVPIVPIALKYGMEATRLASLNKPSWLFADQNDYYESFKDHEKVCFAAFSVDDFFRVEMLCDAIGKLWNVDGERRLSRLITETMNSDARFEFSPALTAAFRNKLKFLRRVVRHHGGTPRMINEKLKYLHQARVSCAAQISYRTHLTQGQLGKQIEGKPIFRTSLHKTAAGEVSFFLQANDDRRDQQTALGQEFCSFCGIHDDRLQYVVEMIMQNNDAKKVHDLLAKKGVRGHEEQEYVPLPVQTLEPAPTPTETAPASAALPEPARQPLGSISGNIRQHDAASAPLMAATSVIEESTPELSRSKVKDVEQGENQDLQSGTSTQRVKLSNADLLPRPESLRGRDAIQAARLREVRENVPFGSGPSTPPLLAPVSDDRYDPETVRRSGPTRGAGHLHASHQGEETTLSAFLPRESNSPASFGVGLSHRSSKTKTAKDLRREQDIGIKGEVIVWNKLKEVLGDDLSTDSWTSELRHEAKLGLPKWRPEYPRATYSDFTVRDVGSRLARWLGTEGVDFSHSDYPTTYHVEVKATTGSAKEPFHISHLQKQLCEDVRPKADEMFLIFRVYGLESRTQNMNIITDPWMGAGLRVEAVDYIVICENELDDAAKAEERTSDEEQSGGMKNERRSECIAS